MRSITLPRALSSSTVTMKSLSLVLIAACLAAATPLNTFENVQQPLAEYQNYPGFNYDLTERRLVQLDNTDEPVWMTELEKIKVKAQGRKFMDMCVSSCSPGLSPLMQSNAVAPILKTSERPPHSGPCEGVITCSEIDMARS